MQTKNGRDNELLKIGELAAFSGVSPKALRMYEKMNIIVPARVDEENGYRYYSPDQVKQVEALLEWKDLGFTLKEIKKIMSGRCSEDDVSLLIDAKQKEWQEKIWVAQARLEELEKMKHDLSYENKKPLKEMSDSERAWYLAKLVCVNDNNVRQAISEAIWL